MQFTVRRSFSLRRSVAMFASIATLGLLAQAAQAQGDITGKWEGRWQECDRSGHACAVVHKADCNKFHVCFTGTCHHIIPFLQDAHFCVVGQAGDCLILEGKSALHLIKYRARASCTSFIVDYCGPHHKGQFILARCGCNGGPPPVAAVSPYAAPPVYRAPLNAPPPPYRGF